MSKNIPNITETPPIAFLNFKEKGVGSCFLNKKPPSINQDFLGKKKLNIPTIIKSKPNIAFVVIFIALSILP